MAETWVINEEPQFISPAVTETFSIQFESNGNAYSGITFDVASREYYLKYGTTSVCAWYMGSFDGWTDQAYRTVTFDASVEIEAPELYAWFNSPASDGVSPNAVKQVTGYSITYHANGGTPEPENLTGQTNLPSPLPTVSKPNFTFDGWYTDSTFTMPAVAGAEISADTDLYAKFTRTHITLDLSTLSLPTGTHSIQIRLSDDGATKRDSELSNAVTYVVAPQLATPQNPVAITSDGTDFAFEPVENAESYDVFADGERIGECEPEPEGETWVINESPNLSGSNSIFTDINFTSNNTTYSSISIIKATKPQSREIQYGGYAVYGPMGWENVANRTVYFPIPPTGDLRTWLNNNAELQ